jgi:hypothetical protein
MDENIGHPGGQRPFAPFLAPDERDALQNLLSFSGSAPPEFVESLRQLARSYIDDGHSRKLRAICLLVADLLEQGWLVDLKKEGIHFKAPGLDPDAGQSIEEVKDRIRSTLQTARGRQLAEPSVRRFLQKMERRTLRQQANARTCVLDLVDNGQELARELGAVAALPVEERDGALASVIDPIVEVCEPGLRCRDTGLPLNEVWRYFRHTWAHEYRAIPGRQLMILIRNAARPMRPVMGIAMLASPVMRVTARDRWIGWLRESLEERLAGGIVQPGILAPALLDRLERSIADVRWDDLLSSGEIACPEENTILRLEQRASGAAYARELQLREHYQTSIKRHGRALPSRGSVTSATLDHDWRAASEDLLFLRKRAELLAQLLFAKKIFRAVDLVGNPRQALEQLLSARSGQRAIDIALTEFRKGGLSSRVADVSICGAVAPYNELLGGKLVALLLASKEVREHYAMRYGDQVSVIASQMAGRPVSKPADLRVLTTTSLYGVGSSQYNRLRLRAAEHEDLSHDLSWDSIGRSRTGGFGTLHLGQDTALALQQMAQSAHTSRRVNNRFGEGTSPRLRQIREGLDALGINSNSVLHHNTPRLFYACELGEGAREALMGIGGGAGDPPTGAAIPAAAISAAWRRRWLAARIQRAETLEALIDLGPDSVRRSLALAPDQDLIAAMAD